MTASDKSYLTTIAIVFAIAITCIAVILRLLARKLNKIPLGADDYCIFVGALFTILNSLVYVFTNKYGNGKHVETLQPEQLVNYWKTFFVSYQLYGIAITAIKLSVLLFYRRIFSTPQFRYWLLGVGALVIAWLFANNLTAAFQCNPPRKFWRQEMAGSCINPFTFVRAIQITNILLDASILALPISGVLRLQMSRVKKISVLAIFLLGGLSTVLAIVRLVVLVNENLDDITYSTGKCSWTVVEPAIEVLSACLPTMAPFLNAGLHISKLRSSLQSLFSSHKSSQSNSIIGRRGQYSGGFNEYKLRPDHIAEVNSAAQAGSFGKAGSESDEIPLKSIGIRQDMDWREERY